MRASAARDGEAVDGILGLVVDDAADGVGAVAQRSGALQHFDFVHALDARVVVAAVANEQAGSDRHAVFEDQRLVICRVQAANADVGDNTRFLFAFDVYPRNLAQGVFGGKRLDAFELFFVDDRDRTRLFGNGFFAARDDVDARQFSLGGDPLGREIEGEGDGYGQPGWGECTGRALLPESTGDTVHCLLPCVR